MDFYEINEAFAVSAELISPASSFPCFSYWLTIVIVFRGLILLFSDALFSGAGGCFGKPANIETETCMFFSLMALVIS